MKIPMLTFLLATKNVYNVHLETCPNRLEMIDDDKQINEKIEDIFARHKIQKALKKKLARRFTCPYCKRVYASENLKHLLGCAKQNPDDLYKLKTFFAS